MKTLLAALVLGGAGTAQAQRANSFNITGVTGVSAQQLFRGAGNKVGCAFVYCPVLSPPAPSLVLHFFLVAGEDDRTGRQAGFRQDY